MSFVLSPSDSIEQVSSVEKYWLIIFILLFFTKKNMVEGLAIQDKWWWQCCPGKSGKCWQYVHVRPHVLWHLAMHRARPPGYRGCPHPAFKRCLFAAHQRPIRPALASVHQSCSVVGGENDKSISKTGRNIFTFVRDSEIKLITLSYSWHTP